MTNAPPDKDTIRICVATDNHLGFKIHDPILKDDAFVTFEEILKIAKRNQVDFLLLGGDLFHKNKPCRETEHRTFQLFRKYCCGDRPVPLKIQSRQKVNFKSNFGRVNYEDPNFNISLPVFAIHGNHDDPTGENALAALDMLSVTNLVNYFGKSSSVDEVHVNPILLSKGRAKLALYGLGYIRDERLYRVFQEKKIKFFRPKRNTDDWFNLFVVHQNRHREEHGKKNVISERMLRSFFDVVVWGHEHKCLIDPQRSQSGEFDVIQPGSSVAVSMVPDEANDKKICILDITKKEYKHTPITLKTVRPFIYERINLNEEYGDKIVDKNDVEEVSKLLEEKIESMIEKAKEKLPPKEILEQHPSLKLPLIRLRVDYSPDYATVHPQRFGQKFVNRVANPKDIIIFSRKKVINKSGKAAEGEKAVDQLEEEELEIEANASVSVEKMLQSFMEQSDTGMNILLESDLQDAVHDYVEKQETKSIEKLLKTHVESMQKRLLDDTKDEASLGEQEILNRLQTYLDESRAESDIRKEQRLSQMISGKKDMDDDVSLSDDDQKSKKSTKKRGGTKKSGRKKPSKKTAKRSPKTRRTKVEEEDEDIEFTLSPEPSPPKKSTRGRKKTTRKQATTEEEDAEVKSPVTKRRKRNIKEEDVEVEEAPAQKRRRTSKPATFITLSDSDEEEAPKKPPRSSLSTSRWGKRKTS